MLRRSMNFNISPDVYALANIPRSGEACLKFSYKKNEPLFIRDIIAEIFKLMKDVPDIKMIGSDAEQTICFYILNNKSEALLIKRYNELVKKNNLSSIFHQLNCTEDGVIYTSFLPNKLEKVNSSQIKPPLLKTHDFSSMHHPNLEAVKDLTVDLSPYQYLLFKDSKNGQAYITLDYSNSAPQFMRDIIKKIFLMIKQCDNILMKGDEVLRRIDFYIPSNTSIELLIKSFNQLIAKNALSRIFEEINLSKVNYVNSMDLNDGSFNFGAVEVNENPPETSSHSFQVQSSSAINQFGIFSGRVQNLELMQELTKLHPLYMNDENIKDNFSLR